MTRNPGAGLIVDADTMPSREPSQSAIASLSARCQVAGHISRGLLRSRARRCLHAEQAQSREDTMSLRVPKADIPTQMSETMIQQFDAVAEPVEVLWHNPSVAQAGLEFGARVGAWNAADESLKTFAH